MVRYKRKWKHFLGTSADCNVFPIHPRSRVDHNQSGSGGYYLGITYWKHHQKFKMKPVRSRISRRYLVLVVMVNLLATIYMNASAQSIGYHPQFNFGFNPYLSPVFGYGLGLPFGAYNFSPTRYPGLLNPMPSAPYADKTGLISKIHAKAFLAKLATSQVLSPGFYGLKDKLNLMKHPEYAYTPFGAAYGYGKHYGAALVPNIPYKSAHSDYLDNGQASIARPIVASPIKPDTIPIGGKLPESSNVIVNVKPYHHYLKPLMKAGALITTAALLGKKIFEIPTKLNPSGMIISELRP